MRFLFKNGTNPNVKTKLSYSFGDLDITFLIFVLSINPNQDSFTRDLIQLLIENGIDVNFRTDNGMTALKIAKRRVNEGAFRPEIITILKNAGAKE